MKVQDAMKKAQEYAEARFAVMERAEVIRKVCNADRRSSASITLEEAQACMSLSKRFGIRY